MGQMGPTKGDKEAEVAERQRLCAVNILAASLLERGTQATSLLNAAAGWKERKSAYFVWRLMQPRSRRR